MCFLSFSLTQMLSYFLVLILYQLLQYFVLQVLFSWLPSCVLLFLYKDMSTNLKVSSKNFPPHHFTINSRHHFVCAHVCRVRPHPSVTQAVSLTASQPAQRSTAPVLFLLLSFLNVAHSFPPSVRPAPRHAHYRSRQCLSAVCFLMEWGSQNGTKFYSALVKTSASYRE